MFRIQQIQSMVCLLNKCCSLDDAYNRNLIKYLEVLGTYLGIYKVPTPFVVNRWL